MLQPFFILLFAPTLPNIEVCYRTLLIWKGFGPLSNSAPSSCIDVRFASLATQLRRYSGLKAGVLDLQGDFDNDSPNHHAHQLSGGFTVELPSLSQAANLL